MSERETRSVIVKCDTPAAYQLWADFDHFPAFMKYIKSVKKTGPRTSHWIVAGPLGRDVEWEAETTGLEPDKRIGWNTKDGQGMTTSGEVIFTPLSHNETQITVTLQYVPPAGKAGEIVAGLFANPGKRLEEDLKNFKMYAEGRKQPEV